MKHFLGIFLCSTSLLIANEEVANFDKSISFRSLWEKNKSVAEETHQEVTNKPHLSIPKTEHLFGVDGSYLYYYVTEDHMSPAFLFEEGITNSGTIDLLGGRRLTQKFDWKNGYNIKAFYRNGMEQDAWEVAATFLQINPKSAQSRLKPKQGSLWIRWTQTDAWQQQALSEDFFSRWQLDLKWAGLEVAKSYQLRSIASYRPYFGMKAAWIDQNMVVDSRSVVSGNVIPARNHSHSKSDAWTLGLQAGCDTALKLGYGLALYANVSTSLPYAHFRVGLQEFAGESEVFSLLTKRNTVTPTMSIMSGFQWEQGFVKRTKIDVAIGYDFHTFFCQNQMRSVLDSSVNGESAAIGNLYLQGLNLSAGLSY